MNITISLDTEEDSVDKRTLNQILTLADEGQSELFEKAKHGWVYYGVVLTENDASATGTIGEINSKLKDDDGTPFPDELSTPETEEIEEILEELEDKGVVKINNGNWSTDT